MIVGDTKPDSEISLNLRWTDYSSARALITEIRRMQKEIRLVKREVSAEQAAVRSEFVTGKATVGHGVGSALGGMIFGRKAMGSINAGRRDDIRRAQFAAMQPYDQLKRLIDGLLARLDQAKVQIELSPEYQDKPQKRSEIHKMTQHAPPLPLPAPQARDFFLFIEEEVKGPFTVHQIEGLFAAGTVDDTTLACPVGSETWISLFEAPELESVVDKHG